MTELDIIILNIGKHLMNIRNCNGDFKTLAYEKVCIKQEVNNYIDFVEGIGTIEIPEEEIEIIKSVLPLRGIKHLLQTIEKEYKNNNAEYFNIRTRSKIEIISIVDDYIEALYSSNLYDEEEYEYSKIKQKKM